MNEHGEQQISSLETVKQQPPDFKNLVGFFALLIEVDKRNQEKQKYD